ncbi:MAG: hypothetical protein ABIS51_23635 [Sphingomonas sp.]
MRLRSILLLLAIPIITAPALSAEGDLAAVAGALAKVRATHGINQERDAGPELTPVKQALRAWIEPQLPANPRSINPDGSMTILTTEDLEALSARLNTSLDAAGLMCGDDASPANPCVGSPTAAENERGYVGQVSIGMLDGGRYLLVVTGVGIRCGFDQSAYVYRHGPSGSWTLLLATEQDRYGKDDYAPQMFVAINASPSGVAWDDPAPPPLVATLGLHPWCSSNWQMLYTRLWRASDTNPTPRPLIDRTDSLYIGVDQIAAARLTPTDLLIEYQAGSVDGSSLIRTHVAHYLIKPGDAIERIAPVALSPNDFVEEWMTSKWPDAARWSDPAANPAALVVLHATPGSADIYGEFDGQAKRCRSDPTLWQAGFSRSADEGKRDLPPVYYKVRWMAPYHFTLVDGGPKPFPGCDEEVAMPDDVGTLFPLQEWRR